MRKLQARPSSFSAFTLILAVAMAAMILYPLTKMIVNLFVVDGRISLSGLSSLTEARTLEVLGNTVSITVASGAIALVIGSLIAWANERTDARMGVFTDTLPLVPFLIPPVAGALGWLLLASPGAGYLNTYLRRLIGSDASSGPLNIHSWWGLVFVYSIYMVPYVFLMVSASLRDLDGSMEEQSRVSGVGALETVRRVTLPAVKPALVGAAYLLTWFGFSMYAVPAVIGPRAEIDVLATRIVELMRFEFPPRTDAAVALAMITLLAVSCVFWIQRRVLRNARYATVGGKARRPTRLELGRWRWPVRLMMLLYVVIAAVLPIFALLALAMRGFWSGRLEVSEWSLDTVRRSLLENPITEQAIRNSFELALLASIVGLVVAALLAMRLKRSSSRWAGALDGAVKLPATLPNVVLALGFLIAFAGPPFNLYGTMAILLVAYLAFYLPQASIAADAAAGQVDDELLEASAVAGAGETRTFATIGVPLMVPGLLAGWAFLFTKVLGELNAAAILATPDNEVLGSRMLNLLAGGPEGLSALAALALAVTAAGAVGIAIGYGAAYLWGRGYRRPDARRRRGGAAPPTPADPVPDLARR